jgi:methionyl-tRNA synthetase
MNLARVGNKYLADSEPWKLQAKDPQRVETILNISLELTAQLASIMSPFLPFTSAKLLAMLNLTACNWKQVAGKALLEAGHQLNEPALLFEKIEDDVIEKQIQKLQSSKSASIGVASNSVGTEVPTPISAGSNPIEPSKAPTSFDDFQKMDIRVGTILTAERVPKTDKLLKLTIDTGIDKRTVVSGIAAHYDPEKIIGQQVTILVNLEPRKIKGIESQGMILMAENANGELAFVAPVKGMENGGSVK